MEKFIIIKVSDLANSIKELEKSKKYSHDDERPLIDGRIDEIYNILSDNEHIEADSIYVPTHMGVEQPPDVTHKVPIIKNGELDFAYWMHKYKTFDHYKQGLSHKQNDITHWLKEHKL